MSGRVPINGYVPWADLIPGCSRPLHAEEFFPNAPYVALKFVDAGGYPVTLRITWDAAFRVNGGAWQDLGPTTGTFTSRHQVRESWPVGVNNAATIGAAP